jgi:CheY-like chemotaxis protein
MPTRAILVVDDDLDVRASMAHALEMEGYRVFVAGNGLEALRLLRDRGERPDLILLDMMMPVMDGWAFRAEQQKLPGIAVIRVVIFTAYDLPLDTAASLQAAGFLKKPLRLDELLEVVERLAGPPRGLG